MLVTAYHKAIHTKNLALTIGDCVSLVARIPRKAFGPIYIGRFIHEHVKEPRAAGIG